jgi:predicted TIM-barrel fold metal-dependent hydrolase
LIIVDSQIHLWTGDGAPANHRTATRANYTYEQALRDMDTAGIHAAVNCPPIWDDSANQYAVEAARVHPNRFATHDWVDLTHEDARARLRSSKSMPGFLGFRFLTASPGNPKDPTNTLSRINWPSDGSLDWVWDTLERLGIPAAIGGPCLVPLAAQIAERHPNLKLTIDHFGILSVAGDGTIAQSLDLPRLARFSNVAVKLSGAPCYAIDAYPFRSMHELVRRLYDAFGPKRLFWGSDITRFPGSWRECVTMFTEEMAWLSDDDKALLMGEAFCAWHGWRPSSIRPALRL